MFLGIGSRLDCFPLRFFYHANYIWLPLESRKKIGGLVVMGLASTRVRSVNLFPFWVVLSGCAIFVKLIDCSIHFYSVILTLPMC